MNKNLTQNNPRESYRMFGLSAAISPKAMSEILGKSLGKSCDGKSKNQWTVIHNDGRQLSVWDYKGHKWSAWGDKSLAAELFGADKIES